jgi:hypothetical protein
VLVPAKLNTWNQSIGMKKYKESDPHLLQMLSLLSEGNLEDFIGAL